jgi:hypothetical protein
MTTKEAEEYLDQEFPKGETKFRGQAMVLLALAKSEAQAELDKQIERANYFGCENC